MASPQRKPDVELDAYTGSGEAKLLCDCRIWFPKDAAEDGWVELSLPASSDTPIYLGPGPLKFVGEQGQGEVTLSGVWIKSGPTRHWPARQDLR